MNRARCSVRVSERTFVRRNAGADSATTTMRCDAAAAAVVAAATSATNATLQQCGTV